ncbi:unnamed protein product [Pneumocystis jirovecii]|uniref:FHA domain-containing protein n=1 Tax=Pneumocystis jirovecii TaxID=42068 RepID=L0PDA5_PNEJI|nr:unnamed protein product [Pneumocystis jirovecii]
MEYYDMHDGGIKQINSSGCLVLAPLNETFERKCLWLPVWPQTLRMGRQTSSRTMPSPSNGFFDSKVLSRAHAEVWTDTAGNVFIRDIQSSNGTFLNGRRLSAEGQVSEPVVLQTGDVLELGIDILNEDDRSIVHRGVAARIEYAGLAEMQPSEHSETPKNTWNNIDSSDSAYMTWVGTYRATTPCLYGTNTYEGTSEALCAKSPALEASCIPSTVAPLESMTEMQAKELANVTSMLNSIQEAFFVDVTGRETHVSTIPTSSIEVDTSITADKSAHCSSPSLVNLEVLAMKQREIDEKTMKIKQLEAERQYKQACEQTYKQVVESLFKEQQNVLYVLYTLYIWCVYVICACMRSIYLYTCLYAYIRVYACICIICVIYAS